MFTNKKSNILPIVYKALNAKLSPISNAYERLKTFPASGDEPEFMHEVWYDKLDYDYANIYFNENYKPKGLGACSGIRCNNLIGRNFDWCYDNSAEFIVHTKAQYGYRATVGVASMVPGLDEAVVETHEYNDSYRILPFLLLDGINDAGLVVQKNVVPKEKGDNKIVNPGAPVSVCSPCLTRYLLDNYDSVDAVVEALCGTEDKDPEIEVYTAKYLEELNYELHFMISDAAKSVIIEFIDGKAVPHEYSPEDKPVMTNFHIDGVQFTEDGKVAAIGGEIKPTSTGLTPHAAGLERFNILVEGRNDVNTVNDMENLMTNVKYTNAYTLEIDKWYSEFVGDYSQYGVSTILDIDNEPEDFTDVLEISKKLYDTRSRETALTWQTVHTSVYDLSSKRLYVRNQERGKFESYDI